MAVVDCIIGLKELRVNKKAQRSVKKEYDEFQSWNAWDEDHVRELSQVVDEARGKEEEAHC